MPTWMQWKSGRCKLERAGSGLLESDRKDLETLESMGHSKVTDGKPGGAPSGERWMSRLRDDNLISSLTIPGTHDSAAFTSTWPFIQTQRLDISEQLNAGIRYFDLRCGLRDDIVEMVHGSAVLGVTLSELLDIMYLWLMSHSSEALVVQIKQDRQPERSEMHFAWAIWECMGSAPARWRTANTTPTLGELRGKIQLLRRFRGPTLRAFGIDVTQWQDNPVRPFTINTMHEVQLTIQDHYKPASAEGLPSLIARKGGDVVELLSHAAANPDRGHWYINFTSAYEFNVWYQLPPREIAVGGYWGFRWEHGMNPRLRGYLHEHQGEGKRRYGIVAMDFPESGADDLVAALIACNHKHHAKDRILISLKFLLLVTTLLLLFVVLTLSGTMVCRTGIGQPAFGCDATSRLAFSKIRELAARLYMSSRGLPQWLLRQTR